MAKLGKYMTTERVPCAPHDVYLVRDRRGNTLASVEWYDRWRCYVVEPEGGAVFNAECLHSLGGFLATIDMEASAEVDEALEVVRP